MRRALLVSERAGIRDRHGDKRHRPADPDGRGEQVECAEREFHDPVVYQNGGERKARPPRFAKGSGRVIDVPRPGSV